MSYLLSRNVLSLLALVLLSACQQQEAVPEESTITFDYAGTIAGRFDAYSPPANVSTSRFAVGVVGDTTLVIQGLYQISAGNGMNVIQINLHGDGSFRDSELFSLTDPLISATAVIGIGVPTGIDPTLTERWGEQIQDSDAFRPTRFFLLMKHLKLDSFGSLVRVTLQATFWGSFTDLHQNVIEVSGGVANLGSQK